MTIAFERATEADAAAIAAVRLAAARGLTAKFGRGTWSFAADSEFGVQTELRTSTLLVARDAASIIGALRLALKNPYAIDTGFFTPVDRAAYLTAMAVAPKHQRQGVGRRLLGAARQEAVELGAQAIRLDSYDAPAGAGEFYRRCGFTEVARGDYRGTPLIWFEWLARPPAEPREPWIGKKGNSW